jgi:hypothetical protein
MMELPEIFKIVAFGDYNNFVTYVNAHTNEVSRFSSLPLPSLYKAVLWRMEDSKKSNGWRSNLTPQIFTTAEPYGINVLFTAARITPHITAKKFMEFILERFPNSQMTADRV